MGRIRAWEHGRKGIRGRGNNRRKGREAGKHQGAPGPASVQAVENREEGQWYKTKLKRHVSGDSPSLTLDLSLCKAEPLSVREQSSDQGLNAVWEGHSGSSVIRLDWGGEAGPGRGAERQVQGVGPQGMGPERRRRLRERRRWQCHQVNRAGDLAAHPSCLSPEREIRAGERQILKSIEEPLLLMVFCFESSDLCYFFH